MITILDVNLSQYDAIVIISSLTVIPILFITLLVLTISQYSRKSSVKLAKALIVISSLLFVLSLIVLVHQLKGNYQEEALLSIISGALMLISALVFRVNLKQLSKNKN